MSRTFKERWTEDPWQQTGEAIGHAIVAMTSLLVFALFKDQFWCWEIVGGAAAMIPWVLLREGIDQWPISSWLDTGADSLEFLAGGALGGLIFKLM